MKLKHDAHLAYCTNIHRAETWAETLAALEKYTLAVRDRVSPGQPFAIGLRLSDLASRELIDTKVLGEFQRWLDKNSCYVFTINGFPFGQFHGQRVKENVYRPDWTSPERVAYTNRLIDLIAQLAPDGMDGSVSTVPGSFKEFISTPEQGRLIRDNIFQATKHAAEASRRTGKKLHLGLEPEPLGWLETTAETVEFFSQIRQENANDSRLSEFLGVNYDTCHLAVEFEEPASSLALLEANQIKISKLHLSSALKIRASAEAKTKLSSFADDVYLHQVITRKDNGEMQRFKDLNPALASGMEAGDEWRVHFHIPLHAPAGTWFEPTTDFLTGVLDVLAQSPCRCGHLEMETYTWEVMPPAMKSRDVVAQLAAEYAWCLAQLEQRGMGLLQPAK